MEFDTNMGVVIVMGILGVVAMSGLTRGQFFGRRD